MSKQITFIHAADLHFGAAFRGLRALSESWAKRMLASIPESYDRVIDAALTNEVDFVVISGDIFDSARASYADYLHFFKGLQKLDEQGIPVYLVTGNHDPFTSWQQDFFNFPPNTTMFPADKPGFAVFEKEGRPSVLVAGRGYYSQAWPKDEDISEGISREEAIRHTGIEAPFAVGVIHTGLNLDPDKAPTDPNELMRRGMDYWALGHIHMKYAIPAENPQVVFSGCIQGRDIMETGERGIFKVTLTEGAPNRLEFIPTAGVVWQRMDVDIAGCGSLGEVADRIVSELFHENSRSHCEEMVVRITLRGMTDLHKVLGKPGVIEDLRKGINDSYPVFFCDSLIDKTVRPHEREVLKKEGLFPAVFLQIADSFSSVSDDQIAYLQDEFLQRNQVLPRRCERNIEELSKEAENLILDLLDRGDD